MSIISPRQIRSSVNRLDWFRLVRLCVLAAGAIGLFGQAAWGVDFVWDQTAAAGPQDWNNGANWNPAGPPMGGDGNYAHISAWAASPQSLRQTGHPHD